MRERACCVLTLPMSPSLLCACFCAAPAVLLPDPAQNINITDPSLMNKNGHTSPVAFIFCFVNSAPGSGQTEDLLQPHSTEAPSGLACSISCCTAEWPICSDDDTQQDLQECTASSMLSFRWLCCPPPLSNPTSMHYRLHATFTFSSLPSASLQA